MIPGKGIMIAMNHRLVNTVINRCVVPADGDILVPIRTVSVIGTTDIRAADPDELPVTQEEVDQMLDDGERLVPGFRKARALRVWAGARPLFQDARAGEVTDTRDVSRTHAVVDHQARDGVKGLLTMSGGKLTTFRLMAQDLVDAMCEQLGEQRPCRTEEVKPPGNEDGEYYDIGSRLRRRERTMADDELICECELIGRKRLEEELVRRWTTNLDDIRRILRLGMGPCQGGFCIYRATGIMHAVERLDGEQAAASLHHFLQERWKGVWPILYGDQLRQARLDDWIFQGLLDIEHLPDGEVTHEPSRRARGRHRARRPDRRGPAGAVRRARARAGEGRRGDASRRRDDRRTRIRAGAGRPSRRGAGGVGPLASVRARRRAAGRGRARLVQGPGRRQRRATPTRARSTRTCCSRRRSACQSPPRWCRSRWPAAICAR